MNPWKIAALSVVSIVLAVALGWGIWALTVVTSPVIGRGEMYKDQQSSQNREYWISKYQHDYQMIQADQEAISTLKASGIVTQQDKINLQGAEMNCQQDVANYNGNVNNALGSPWLAANLPSQIDPNQYCH